ncbi:unnamed protein product [Nippostrongylus brasiliensis]|uniref:RICTOR_N domain-containing protein n=1 Tax=Nippostrongylus brasiliensis TaxID=27835 RepID=A0A0N4XWZ8_NIPBR|nr:unnamed protein product [Nippostrongylus brasiliensis]
MDFRLLHWIPLTRAANRVRVKRSSRSKKFLMAKDERGGQEGFCLSPRTLRSPAIFGQYVQVFSSIFAALDRSDAVNYIRENAGDALSGDFPQRRLFLNQLACYLFETLPESLNDSAFFEELCLLLLKILQDDHSAIRAMCFRLLRLCLFTEKNLVFILTTNAEIFAVRALDLLIENDAEREEALQLIYAMMMIYEQSHLKRLIEFSVAQQNGKKYAFPKSVMQPVIALALRAICFRSARDHSSSNEKANAVDNIPDRLSTACLEMFLEFCVLEPDLILNMAGTEWMVRILTGDSSTSRRIAAVVARVLVAWLDQPKIRAKGKLHLVLEQIFAPLIEFGFFQKNLPSTELGDRIAEAAISNFSHSFLCILRSWSGLFACAAIGPTSTVMAASPFRLLEYLGLGTIDNTNLYHIRDMVVDLCCNFLDLPYASVKFESWTHALEYYSSLTFPDDFSSSLKDSFVLAQFDMCVANDESLARLIVAQPDSSSGLKATLFVADVLRTATSVMPTAWRATVLSTPTLVQSAFESLAQSKAAAATHGYYDPSYNDRYTFPNSGNAAMILHRFDTLNKVCIANASCGPPADSNYSLFLSRPKPIPLPYQYSFDEIISGENDDINWEAAAIVFTRATADVKDIGKSLSDALWIVFDKVMTALSPHKAPHKGWKDYRFPLVVGRTAIWLGLELANEEEKFLQTLVKYTQEFCTAFSEYVTVEGLPETTMDPDFGGPHDNPQRSASTDMFSMKSLVDSGSMYYFCLIGVMSAHPTGVMILEKSGLLQTIKRAAMALHDSLDDRHHISYKHTTNILPKCIINKDGKKSTFVTRNRLKRDIFEDLSGPVAADLRRV